MKRSFNTKVLKNWRWWVTVVPSIIVFAIALVVKGLELTFKAVFDKVLTPVVSSIHKWTFNK
jgi:uncharacterized membrane protein